MPKNTDRRRTVRKMNQIEKPSLNMTAVIPADIPMTDPTERSNSPEVMSSVMP
jgi:hypothetical protein